MGKIGMYVFILLFAGLVLIYAAGASLDTGALSQAFQGGVKAIYGPGKYATGTA